MSAETVQQVNRNTNVLTLRVDEGIASEELFKTQVDETRVTHRLRRETGVRDIRIRNIPWHEREGQKTGGRNILFEDGPHRPE
jgi:hypothetical protein